MQWTQKETMLLQDMINSEQICIEKYTDYAERACDPELRTLFDSIKTVEQGHYDTLSQMANGTIPQMSAQGGQPQGNGQAQGGTNTQAQGKANGQAQGGSAQSKKPGKTEDSPTEDCEEDEYLCRDALDTEKHVSSLYDTCIFEFVSAQARDVLNHIQKEEQEHGKQIYDYMSAHGMSA